MNKAYSVIHLDGTVQGVGFRYATHIKANAIGLTGYVRNLPNGQVEILAGGAKDQRQSLINWLKTGGPKSAKITAIKVASCSPRTNFVSFDIR